MGQNSNFSFLKEHWAFLLQDAQQVESYALRDPRAASICARRTLEIALKWLFANDIALKAPYEKSLAAMIHEPTFAYELEQAVDNGFLVPPGAISVPLKFQREGIKNIKICQPKSRKITVKQVV